jgi:hypothetical protein
LFFGQIAKIILQIIKKVIPRDPLVGVPAEGFINPGDKRQA